MSVRLNPLGLVRLPLFAGRRTHLFFVFIVLVEVFFSFFPFLGGLCDQTLAFLLRGLCRETFGIGGGNHPGSYSAFPRLFSRDG